MKLKGKITNNGLKDLEFELFFETKEELIKNVTELRKMFYDDPIILDGLGTDT